MNKARRKQIAEAIALIEQAQTILADVAADEQEAFDNMPEGLQQADNGQKMEEAIRTLEEKNSDLETTIDELRELL